MKERKNISSGCTLRKRHQEVVSTIGKSVQNKQKVCCQVYGVTSGSGA